MDERQLIRRRTYFRNRYREQREWAIEFLGGKCANCGNDDLDDLEFDHSKCEIHPYTRVSAVIRGWSRERLMKLFKDQKIQLLCTDCHLEKSLGERS